MIGTTNDAAEVDIMMVILLLIGLFAIGVVIFTGSWSISEKPVVHIPLNCGITEQNNTETETYTYSTMCGKVACMQTGHRYYVDLVCTNGTTVNKYRQT